MNSEKTIWPLRWGMQSKLLHTVPWGEEMLRHFGIEMLVMFPHPANQTTGTIAQHMQAIREVDAWCEQQNVSWVANLEAANYWPDFIDELGRDWFNRPDGRHFFLTPEEFLPVWGSCRRLAGLLYDEAELMQIWRNQTVNGMQKPWIYDPTGRRLEDACEEFTAAVAEHAQRHAEYGIHLFTEHVLPILFHNFARAGWTSATKVMKETWAAPYLACAMGAALQYGTELWVCPDLWDCNKPYPGHSPHEYYSALLLSYHLGADCIYTENLDHNFGDPGVGSLVKTTSEGYTVTPYGEQALRFRHDYVPNHPREYSFRHLRPRVAIIRQEDTCWGQADSWISDTLFGSPEWQSTSTSEAWLRLWHLLSCGVIPADSLSWHGGNTWRNWQGRPHQTFCPLDGVVVFDHTVKGELLEGTEVIFLTGLAISAETLAAVEAQVAAGTTCVALAHLLPERVTRQTSRNGTLKDGAGLWVSTDDFLAPHARKQILHVLPNADTLRYQFGEHSVVLHPEHGDPDRLLVEIS